MTIPTHMNCPHSEDGWCLDCVVELVEKREIEIEQAYTEGYNDACLKKSCKYCQGENHKVPPGG